MSLYAALITAIAILLAIAYWKERNRRIQVEEGEEHRKADEMGWLVERLEKMGYNVSVSSSRKRMYDQYEKTKEEHA